MGQIDRSVARKSLLAFSPPIESPAGVQEPETIGQSQDDPLAAARGTVNGVIFGILLWVVILWALL